MIRRSGRERIEEERERERKEEEKERKTGKESRHSGRVGEWKSGKGGVTVWNVWNR